MFSLEASLPPGDYKVIVLPLSVRGTPNTGRQVVSGEKPAPDIPLKYRTIGTTDLKADVKEGKNEFTFNMKR